MGTTRIRHPLRDCPPLDTPTVLEEAEEVTLIIRRKDGRTLTATFGGESLCTALAYKSVVERGESISALHLDRLPPPQRRHYDLRIDILDGSTATFIVSNREV